MEQKDQLFALIKSLSKAEKRYFTIDASRYAAGKEKNYLKLFRILDDLKSYDSSQIKLKLKGQKMAGNLALEKHQLFDHILDSLRKFHSETSKVSKLMTDLKMIDILKSKDLKDQSRKILFKVKKTCYEFELFELLIQVISMQIKLLDIADPDYKNAISECITERSAVWEKIRNIDEVQLKRAWLGQIQGEIGSPQNERELSILLNFHEEFVSLEDGLLSITAQNIYYRTLSLYHNLMLNYTSAGRYNQLRYDLYNNNNWLIETDPKEYVIFLYFYIQNQMATGSYEHALEMMRTLEAMREEYREHRNQETFMEIERRLIPLTVYIHSQLKNYDVIIEKNDELKSFLERHWEDLPVFRRNGLIYNIAQTHFLCDLNKECHSWLVPSIQDQKSKTDFESYYFISLLMIINCCKLNNWDFAQSHIMSIKRYVKQREKDDTLGLDLFQMLGRYIQHEDHSSKVKELIAFETENKDWLDSYMGEHVFLSKWWREHQH